MLYPDGLQLVEQVSFLLSQLDEQAGEVQPVVPDRIQARSSRGLEARSGRPERQRGLVEEEVVVGQDEEGNAQAGDQQVDRLGSNRHHLGSVFTCC